MLVIEGIIPSGIDAGIFKKLCPIVVTEIFIASISGMIEGMSLSGEFCRAEAVVPTLMDLFLGGVRNTQ